MPHFVSHSQKVIVLVVDNSNLVKVPMKSKLNFILAFFKIVSSKTMTMFTFGRYKNSKLTVSYFCQ